MSTLGLPTQKVTVGKEILIENSMQVYNASTLEQCKEKFLQLQEDGIIENKNFEDKEWTLRKFNARRYPKFNIDIPKELNNVLKCFLVIEIHDRKSSISTVCRKIKDIKDALLDTNNFDIEYTGQFINYLCDEISESYAESKSINLSYFLRFYSINNSDEYYDLLSKCNFKSDGVRTIAQWSSIIEFDYLLRKFYEEEADDKDEDERLKKKYLPILLWWRLTKVIPMRPIELTLLKKDCLFKEGDKYYIKIKRSKIRKSDIGKKYLVRLLDKLQIDEDMAELMKVYQTMANYKDEESFFLSYNLYNSTIKSERYRKARAQKLERDYLTTECLDRLLKDFYDEIITKKEGYGVIEKGDFVSDEQIINSNTIERIQLGDTRHLAFCSMMLQGFNPLTIAQIGGHTDIRSQNHYCQHLDTLVRGQVNILTKRIRADIDKKFEIIKDFYNPKKEIKIKMIMEKKFRRDGQEPRKAQDGFCWNKHAPEKKCYHLDCFFCDYFTINPDDIDTELLSAREKQFNHELEKAVNFLKEVFIGMKVDTDNETFSLEDQTQLKTASRHLQSLIAKYTLISTHSSKSKEINQ